MRDCMIGHASPFDQPDASLCQRSIRPPDPSDTPLRLGNGWNRGITQSSSVRWSEALMVSIQSMEPKQTCLMFTLARSSADRCRNWQAPCNDWGAAVINKGVNP
jgi:hypothetical protein